MEAFFASLALNLRRLFDFDGRETQIQFWPYAGFVYGVATAIGMVMVMVPIMQMFMTMMIQIQAASEQGPYATPDFVDHPEALMADMSGLFLPTLVLNLVTVLLLAAAVARRLHDKDRSGWWGLLPLPSMAIGMALMPAMMAQMFTAPEAPNPAIMLGALNNMIYFGLFVVLVVLLIGKGTPGPNRFGEEVAPAAR